MLKRKNELTEFTIFLLIVCLLLSATVVPFEAKGYVSYTKNIQNQNGQRKLY